MEWIYNRQTDEQLEKGKRDEWMDIGYMMDR